MEKALVGHGGEPGRLLQQAFPPPGQGQEPAALLRQLQPALALAPLEQDRPRLPLQRLETGRQGGLGDEQGTGRRRHGRMLQDGEKGLDIQLRHRDLLLSYIDYPLYYNMR